MMRLKKRIDSTRNLTVYTTETNLTPEQIMQAIHAFYTSTPTQHVLWDLSGLSVGNFSAADVEQLACFAPRFNPVRKDGKTALVARDPFTRILSDLFVLSGEMSGIPVRVKLFSSVEDALQWITA